MGTNKGNGAKEGLRLLVSGGGTGGHLFPGIAVAEAFLAKDPANQALFVGTGRPTDERVLATRGFDRTTIRCSGLKGKSLLARLAALAQLPTAVAAALRIMRTFQPHVVLGVGGYITGPVLLAARLRGIPTCIHEQNSIPGMANRYLGKLVERVFLTIPGSERSFAAGKWVLTGNPLRQELIVAARQPRRQAGETKKVLVLGGSLGAHRLNTLMMEAMTSVAARGMGGVAVIHQTGAADELAVAARYRELGIPAQVAAFFDDMATLYREADLVLSRAGATTLAEITLFGLPMVLVPYPFAADDHQRGNAEFLVQGGAAVLRLQEELSGEGLADLLVELLASEAKVAEMGAAAKGFARPGATDHIVDLCIGLARARVRARV